MARKRGSVVTKIVVALVVIAALGWLFLRTVRETRATPYTARAADLQGWPLVSGTGDPEGALAGLQPSAAFMADLFKQIFARNMESLSSPATALVPVVLQRETASLGDIQAEAVVSAARDAGLERAPLVPRCVAVRRLEPPASYDYYFILFEPAPFEAARTRLHTSMGNGAAGFDPAALPPSLVIATSDPAVRSVLPFTPDPARDCVAPVTIG